MGNLPEAAIDEREGERLGFFFAFSFGFGLLRLMTDLMMGLADDERRMGEETERSLEFILILIGLLLLPSKSCDLIFENNLKTIKNNLPFFLGGGLYFCLSLLGVLERDRRDWTRR